MPNGHGGVPPFGGPVFLALLFGVAALAPLGGGWLAWTRDGICMVLAAAVGWRIAYHVRLYGVDHYGGAYTPPEVHRRASRRYRIATLLYAPLTAAAGFGILWWRGLP